MAKGIGLREYLNLMFKVNYSNEGSKIIRDSYSFYGFNKKKLKVYFDGFKQNLALEDDDIFDEEEFSASINIGIQNYNVYKEFLEEVSNVTPEIKDYALFGRHDISLVNERANLKWLIYIQYLLDKFTINDMHPADSLFFTHETFVKVSCDHNLKDTDGKRDDLSFDKAKDELDRLCCEFFSELDEELYNGEYRIPVQAVKYSILSI